MSRFVTPIDAPPFSALPATVGLCVSLADTHFGCFSAPTTPHPHAHTYARAEGKIPADAEEGDGAEMWSEDDDNEYYRQEVGEEVPEGELSRWACSGCSGKADSRGWREKRSGCCVCSITPFLPVHYFAA